MRATVHCRRLFKQLIRRERSFALLSAGRSRPARMAMMAMTTNNSINVKATRGRRALAGLAESLGVFIVSARVAVLGRDAPGVTKKPVAPNCCATQETVARRFGRANG